MKRIFSALALGIWGALGAMPAQAQSLFDPVAFVNDGVVTRFEVVQRQRFLSVLRRPAITQAGVLEELIEDQLKLDAARRADIVPGIDEIELGMEDFAARADLTAEEFILALEDVGIEEETFRDFIRVQIAWGELVRTRFIGRARPSEAEIDRAVALGTGRGSARVLISEIILPMSADLAPISEERAQTIAQMTSQAEFEEAARRFSVAPSRENGGRLDWLPLSELPPQVAPLFLTLGPGEVTDPIIVGNALALFQFRAIQDIDPPRSADESLDYTVVYLPAGTNMAAERVRVLAVADTCDDLYGVFLGASEQQLVRTTTERSQIGGQVRGVLEGLDPGEIGVLNSPTAPALVMLCGRTEIREEEITRGAVAQQLLDQRLNTLADGYLSELEAEAFIEVL
ncbi:MAG: peptidylprolyl isomerase [Pseudomonadota bacterium]